MPWKESSGTSEMFSGRPMLESRRPI